MPNVLDVDYLMVIGGYANEGLSGLRDVEFLSLVPEDDEDRSQSPPNKPADLPIKMSGLVASLVNGNKVGMLDISPVNSDVRQEEHIDERSEDYKKLVFVAYTSS